MIATVEHPCDVRPHGILVQNRSNVGDWAVMSVEVAAELWRRANGWWSADLRWDEDGPSAG